MNKWPKFIIFDLSEVIISGLIGCEEHLSAELGGEACDLDAVFLDDNFWRLLHGEVSEAEYLNGLLVRMGWSISPDRIMAVVRRNFHGIIDGMPELLEQLSKQFSLILLSDHAKEWVEYIEAHHTFFSLFAKKFYSFSLKGIKADPNTFLTVLREIEAAPEECVFVDDSLRNVKAAQSVGITALQFANRAQLTRELGELGISI